MALSKETEKKIQELQLMEQSLQQFLAQKQGLQMQVVETESAIEALDETENAFKIVGSIMIRADKEHLKTDLTEKKETAELRMKSIEKQENLIREKAEKLQKEVLEELEAKAK